MEADKVRQVLFDALWGVKLKDNPVLVTRRFWTFAPPRILLANNMAMPSSKQKNNASVCGLQKDDILHIESKFGYSSGMMASTMVGMRNFDYPALFQSRNTLLYLTAYLD